MKNVFKVKAVRRIAGIIALVAIIGFSMAACSDDGGGGDSALNGTWLSTDRTEKVKFSNGDFTAWTYDIESMKGTYSTSGNDFTLTVKQVKAGALGLSSSEMEMMGLTSSKWYTQKELRTLVIKALVDKANMTQADAEAYYNSNFARELDPYFDPQRGTYSLNGNTLTLTMSIWGTTVYTKQ